ncbi:hypothetical protein HMPREF1320_0756 [Capnocytophaga sp. oral taxon 335 str. F0486]|nr:hypothetical protein HMPREF1320_0756 [Capnocytophaga sp. oral taxon 335 str. F0486]
MLETMLIKLLFSFYKKHLFKLRGKSTIFYQITNKEGQNYL